MKRKIVISKNNQKLLLHIDNKCTAVVDHLEESCLVHSYVDGRVERHVILRDDNEIMIESEAAEDWIKLLQGGEGPDSIRIHVGSDRTGVEKDLQVYIKGNVTFSLDDLKKTEYDIKTHSVVFTY